LAERIHTRRPIPGVEAARPAPGPRSRRFAPPREAERPAAGASDRAGAGEPAGPSGPAAVPGLLERWRLAARAGHRLDRIRVGAATGPAAAEPEAAAPGGGGLADPLPGALRVKMERAFRRDFSRVRLRLTDEPRQIGARALTRGEEIAMAPYHFRPESLEGQALIGHELAHVLQQRERRPGLPGGARERSPRGGGGVLDSPPFEAEARRQGEQAARGEPVAFHPSGAGAPPASLAPPSALFSSGAAPAQPGWEWVDLGGGRPPVKKNLTDNGNGTWTLKGGGTFQDSGTTHPTNGARLLSSTAPQVNAPQQPVLQQPGNAFSYDPKNVLFNFDENGKVIYLGNTAQNRLNNVGKYYEAKPEDFATFKSSGKRTASPKVLDPVSLKRYAYDETGKQFYEWDRKKSNRRGQAIDTTQGLLGAPSPNDELVDRLTKGELVDRRRDDRTKSDLLPFDVGPYKNQLTLPSESHPSESVTYQSLTGINAWQNGNLVNRDHVPSGESLNQRGDSSAYNQGVTITIPNPEFHVPFSPTYGTDNSLSKGALDEYGGSQIRRLLFDKDNPQAAAYRDTKFQFDSTENQDFSSSGHSHLDLTQPENRLRQIGAYRKLNRLNAKLNKKYGARRGFDPSSKAIDFKAEKRKKKSNKRRVGYFKYTDVPNKTQGGLFKELYGTELTKTKRAKLI
jgi:Domain of unknown function (DUF4157)